MELVLYREHLTYNNAIYTYIIYAVLLVVFIEYNLFDRKLQKINEKIEDLTNKNELLVKENANYQLQLHCDVKKLQEENENKNDEIDYILRRLDYYIEKYRDIEVYIDDTIHANTQYIEEKIEESIEDTRRKLEKTHEDLSRLCFSRHACIIDEIESIRMDLQENREKTHMLPNINDRFTEFTQKLEVINENNREKTVMISSINKMLTTISRDIYLIYPSNSVKIQELNAEHEKMSKMVYALRKYISLDVITNSYNPKIGSDYNKSNNEKMKLYTDEIYYD